MLTARAVYNCADTYGEVWHLGPDDRGIVCLPMAWMYGLASTSLALLMRGATAIVVRRARPDLLVEAIVDNRATFLAGVTTTFAKLVQHAERTPLPASTFESLRLCISGGEPRNEKAFERWHSLTGVAVLDAYCASECLPLVTYDPFTDPVPRPGSAGKLVPRSLLRIVDADGAEVPQGEVGEGLSSGPGVMLGYWRDPEQTREALTEDGWYRTKDLLRMDADGFVYVVGRLSDVIIRAGVNISPAEVERVIRLHESVDDVAVVGLPDEMYGQRVVAAIASSSQVDLDQVDAHVRAHLSSYKVPSDYVVVEQLPVNTTTGKVDRRGLATQLSQLRRNSRLRRALEKELAMSNDGTPDRYWVTGVSEVTDEKVYIRGYDLEDIVGDLPFTAAAYLLIRGHLPTPQQVRVLDGVLSAVLDYGLEKPGSVAARYAVSANPSMAVGLAAACLSVGQHTLATEDTSRFIIETFARFEDSVSRPRTSPRLRWRGCVRPASASPDSGTRCSRRSIPEGPRSSSWPCPRAAGPPRPDSTRRFTQRSHACQASRTSPSTTSGSWRQSSSVSALRPKRAPGLRSCPRCPA